MAKAERLEIIRQLETERQSRVICYVTSTRPNMEVQMAMDSVRKIYEHLTSVEKKKIDIDLLIHSNGGDGTVPWRLVTLIREYARKFSVLVPHKAFSAATLTALGADAIVMHPMGMLGPTDPTVTNPFNPRDQMGRQLGISVEDVTAYIALIKEDAGITHEDELVQAFNKLADGVHPLALGNVKRFHSQSRLMARKLLALHMDLSKDEHRLAEIVDNLTSKLFYHGHPINREEARNEVGLKTVKDATPQIEQLMWKLYLHYEAEMKMDEPFQAAQEFIAQNPKLQAGQQAITKVATAKIAYIESSARTDVLTMDYELSGSKAANGVTTVTMVTQSQGWANE